MTPIQNRPSPFSFLRDIRFIQAIGQIIFAIVIVAALSIIAISVTDALKAQNLAPNFSYLNNRAGFDIGEQPGIVAYTSDNTFFEAFIIGLINTMRVIVVGLVLATVIGVFFGVFLLSSNWLVRTIARTYVEILRNIPLAVQLTVWYFIVMFSLPVVQQSIALPAEGVLFIALRLLLYPIAVWLVMSYGKGSIKQRDGILGVAALAFMIEGGLWLSRTQTNWANVPGKADLGDASFWLYLVVSLGLIAAAWQLPQRFPILRDFRTRGLFITLGQFVGGLMLYFGLVPGASIRTEIYPAVYINNRGFTFPEILTTGRFNEWLLFVVVGVVVAIFLWIYFSRVVEATGKPIPYGRYALLTVIGFMIAGWILVQLEPEPALIPVQQDGNTVYMSFEDARAADLLTTEEQALYSRSPLMFLIPVRSGFNFKNGIRVSPEYMALLLGLSIYTSAFVAEIVRAGIQAVPYGQVEAARSIGLPYIRVLRLIVLPQALRVIIPPLGNQYLNLAKNSSLAVLIAYADLFQVTRTIMNTSGQSVPGIIMVMLTYLVISLLISAGTNWFNRRLRYVTN
ncbi:MAG: ABC transporter permease subunit [Chitinophagaceae bacterium]|nr:ABC transporter permease subunit [Anaerolineae bacterium]